MKIHGETFKILYPFDPIQLQTPDQTRFVIFPEEGNPPYTTAEVKVKQKSFNPPPYYPTVIASLTVKLQGFYRGYSGIVIINQVLLNDPNLGDITIQTPRGIRDILNHYIDHDLITPQDDPNFSYNAYYAQSSIRMAEAAFLATVLLNQSAIRGGLPKIPTNNIISLTIGNKSYCLKV